MSDTPLLELRGVSKHFGAVIALHEVDFRVEPGCVAALVGDNGAGKSTLIKCVAGIYRIDGGEVFFEGKPVTIHGPRQASDLGIEVVYQDLALADNLDVVGPRRADDRGHVTATGSSSTLGTFSVPLSIGVVLTDGSSPLASAIASSAAASASFWIAL